MELVELDGLVVNLRLQGACNLCPSPLPTGIRGILGDTEALPCRRRECGAGGD